MKKQIEVEVKYRVESLEPIEKMLEGMGGFMYLDSGPETDTYYNCPSNDLQKTGEVIRIRVPNETELCELTYKGPRIDNETKSREEYVIHFHHTDVMDMILKRLGAVQSGVVNKYRKTVGVDVGLFRPMVMLDEIEGVGKFVEIEIMADESEYQLAKETVLYLAKSLGLKIQEPKSYIQLVKEKPV